MTLTTSIILKRRLDITNNDKGPLRVNNANSAIILINCLISQGCKSGSIGQGSPCVPRGPCGKSGQGGQLG